MKTGAYTQGTLFGAHMKKAPPYSHRNYVFWSEMHYLRDWVARMSALEVFFSQLKSCLVISVHRQSLFSGMDSWNGLLECPLTFNLTTKLPLLSQSGCVCVRELCLQSAHSLHRHQSIMHGAPFSPKRSVMEVAEKFSLLLVWLERRF